MRGCGSRGWDSDLAKAENKRKAKASAAERAKQVTRTRETKTMVVAIDLREGSEEETESVLKERRASVGLGGSSS